MISTALMSQIYIVNIINKISATLLLAVLLFAKRFAGLDVITFIYLVQMKMPGAYYSCLFIVGLGAALMPPMGLFA